MVGEPRHGMSAAGCKNDVSVDIKDTQSIMDAPSMHPHQPNGAGYVVLIGLGRSQPTVAQPLLTYLIGALLSGGRGYTTRLVLR